MKRFILFITILLSTLQLFAQRENDTWYLGTTYGLKFDANDNTSMTELNLMSSSGGAVSDKDGNLLFYTNGRVIKDRNHNIMPNSRLLTANDADFQLATMSVTYGVIVGEYFNIQVIQMDKAVPRYMVFYVNYKPTAIRNFDTLNSHYYDLCYSIVDMRLNNGMGDVDPNFKNVVVGKHFLPTLAIIPNGKCNAWVVAPKNNENAYYAYPILPNESVGNPIKSTSNILQEFVNNYYVANNQAVGHFALNTSPLYNYIVFDHYRMRSEISKFDPVSGKVMPILSLQPLSTSFQDLYTNFRFSPDESKVYAQGRNHRWIYQMDATKLADSTSFFNSMLSLDLNTLVDTPFSFPVTYVDTLKREFPYLASFRARKDNMYGAMVNNYNNFSNNITNTVRYFIYKIENPNDLLTNINIKYEISTPFNLTYHFNVPLRDSIEGNFTQRVINTEVASQVYNLGKDMVIFQPNTDLDTVVTLDTVICGDVNMTLTTRYADATNIRWSTGSSDSSINIDATGRYTVTVTYPHCSFTEVFWVRSPLANISLSVNDTLMCTERPFVVHVNREGVGGRAVWQNGMIGDSMIINKGGTYHVTIKTDCGSVSDTLHVQEMSCRCSYFVPNAFTPNGDGLNDLLIVHIDCIPLEYQMHIYNRYGQLVNKLEKYGEYWDGTFIDKQPAASGVYFYRMRYKDLAGDYQTVTGDVTLLR